MFHAIINFCLFVFICYAVSGAARAILFGGSTKKKAARGARGAAAPSARRHKTARRRARVIRIKPGKSNKAARSDMRAA